MKLMDTHLYTSYNIKLLIANSNPVAVYETVKPRENVCVYIEMQKKENDKWETSDTSMDTNWVFIEKQQQQHYEM